MATREDPKRQALAQSRTLNPHPEKVTDPAFTPSGFFDPDDVVQVKYEMVRRANAEGMRPGQAAASFGFSRQAFYTAKQALAERGLAGLLPGKPGPKGGHKLTDEVLDYVEELLRADPGRRPAELAAEVESRFGMPVHARSVRRALHRRASERAAAEKEAAEQPDAGQLTQRYEQLRQATAAGTGGWRHGPSRQARFDPGAPGCLPGLRFDPLSPRLGFSGGGVCPGRSSVDGGIDELPELRPSCRSNFATRASRRAIVFACTSINAACEATSASNSSRDKDSGPDTPQLSTSDRKRSCRHAAPQHVNVYDLPASFLTP